MFVTIDVDFYLEEPSYEDLYYKKVVARFRKVCHVQ